MFARKNSKVALTFLCLVVALGLATVSEANSLVHKPRDHVDLNRRMIKVRATSTDFLGIPIIGAEGGPTASASTDTASATSASSATDSATASASGSVTGSASSTDSATDSASATSLSSASSSSSIASSSSTDSSSSSSSSISSSSTSSSSSLSSDTASATPTPTSTQAAEDNQPSATNNTPSSTQTSTLFVTASDSSASAASTGASTLGSGASSKITRTTLTVIIVIAASIGAVALAWTLFRKWKLRPSSNFDDRMQPIDWQPTTSEDSGLPSHRRAGSAASHGSFHSSGHNDSYGSTSNHGHAGLNPLPEHDFTAGPSALAPVGGYADLQRGPSPQPMAELARGPSVTRQQYGNPYDYNAPRY